MTIKTRQQLIRKYIKFFKSKKHKEIPNSSLIPSNDPTVLFTTAGMHPLIPYLTGQKHPLGKRLVNVQKCIRTGDIDKVGNATHHTFFEMLGNWSLGDYWKKETIEMSLEFLTKELKIPKTKLSISCFKGDKDAIKDTESAEIWKSLGIKKIKFLGKGDNWWGPAGETGPCGPDTEIFVDDVEIWNDVFMQYNKTPSGKYENLSQKNVDTGMGVERTLSVLLGLDDNYLSPTFLPIIKEIEKISKKKYTNNKKEMRIIADHIKAAVFIIADGVLPSNLGQGYVLRRLIRRAIRHGKLLGIEENFTTKLFPPIHSIYLDYAGLKKNRNHILTQLDEEENKFRKKLPSGAKEYKRLSASKKTISGKDAFLLYQSYGFPLEMTVELAKEENKKVDIEGFEKESKKHVAVSGAHVIGTFSSGLSDASEKTTRLHTATHLLNEALRIVLGEEVKQRGSNITPERLRFDFNFSRKLTPEEIKKIEDLINKKIKASLKVVREEISLKGALSSGAQAEFGHKYPERVSVYTIIDKSDKRGWFSKEICTGPHVQNTKEIGTFKIVKEQSSAAGVRRIKAIIE